MRVKVTFNVLTLVGVFRFDWEKKMQSVSNGSPISINKLKGEIPHVMAKKLYGSDGHTIKDM